MTADDNRRYLLWSTDGFPKMLNGRSSLNPRSFLDLEARLRDFPDRASIELLRTRGVASVALHRDDGLELVRLRAVGHP